MKHHNALYISATGAIGVALGFLMGLAVGNAKRSTPHATATSANTALGDGARTSEIAKGLQASIESEAEAELRTAKIADAINQALQQPRPVDEVQLLGILNGLSKDEFPVFLQMLRNANKSPNLTWSPYGGPLLWTLFWQKFGEVDPSTALSNALTCGDLRYPLRETLEKHLFTGMARNDPQAAAQLFLAHPELPNRNRAAEGLMLSWAGLDVQAAMDWARSNLKGADLNLGTFAATWGVANGLSERPDIAGGLSFAQSLEGEGRTSAINALRMIIADRPQVSAPELLEFIAATHSLGVQTPDFDAQLAARCAALDPYAAASFFTQPRANGEVNNFAELRALTAAWVQRDRNAAELWAKQQEGTEHFAIVAEEFAKDATNRGDAAAAKRWLDVITSQSK